MPKFGTALNEDLNMIRTSARYDADAATWLHDSGMFVKTAAGVWAPVSPTNPMPSALAAGANTVGKVDQGVPGAASWPVTVGTLTDVPVHGAKTVTSLAASIFAGAARLANRRYLAVYNESANTVYVGGSGVTTASGFPILPGDYRVFAITPGADFGIYAIAGANSAVRVEEGK
jgi:hypothetical protein